MLLFWKEPLGSYGESREKELLMLKRAQDAEQKWRGAQALIEQIQMTLSEKEKELENTVESLKRQQERELFKLNQENYILQAKVTNPPFSSGFPFCLFKNNNLKKKTVLLTKFLVVLGAWSCWRCICHIKCGLCSWFSAYRRVKWKEEKENWLVSFVMCPFKNTSRSSLWPSEKWEFSKNSMRRCRISVSALCFWVSSLPRNSLCWLDCGHSTSQ